MLFNSYEFIFVYLPCVLGMFFLTAKKSHSLAIFCLAIASLVFYGWLTPQLVLLLLASIILNYGFARSLMQAKNQQTARYLLILAIGLNLANIGVFKYAKFFLQTMNALPGMHLPVPDIVLPLGISFFTFTQIAFLVDVYRGKAQEVDFIHYLLFVTYFPHLIAGPIIHHAQVMPQLLNPDTGRLKLNNVALGLSIFTVGLAKKVLLADNFSAYADAVFLAAKNGEMLALETSWVGVLSYTLQLYFDFSGYSDMAVGLSLLFGVRLPVNFASPYKAASIIDFWRRWHMTLSQFLLQYLYIPLGGNRKGPGRRYLNLGITMLLGGLWHGANWTFLVWGGLHGIFLMVNHLWREVVTRHAVFKIVSPLTSNALSCMLTFVCVMFAWIFFRAENVSAALVLLKGCMGEGNSFIFTPVISILFWDIPYFSFLTLGCFLIWCLPNTQEIFSYCDQVELPRKTKNEKRWHIRWIPHPLVGLFLGCVLCLSLSHFYKVSTFLYYQF
ncbi:MBOAT family protein [Undibacterium sp. CY18W]|uniref:Probable alginate O-acetylase AlgI n=1 Tax=Undibacterium hunanense TaxID=2762292 RepID=A0ABR6ZVS6_9BURK|nr:MBOAT family protein [Undibacterium hunanense]